MTTPTCPACGTRTTTFLRQLDGEGPDLFIVFQCTWSGCGTTLSAPVGKKREAAAWWFALSRAYSPERSPLVGQPDLKATLESVGLHFTTFTKMLDISETKHREILEALRNEIASATPPNATLLGVPVRVFPPATNQVVRAGVPPKVSGSNE